MFQRYFLASLLALLLAPAITFAQTGTVGIGTTAPDPSAALDLTSTSKGLLPPRMTQAQRNAIASPATGLVVYQTDNSPGLYCYCNAGPATSASWQALALQQQPAYATFPVSASSVSNTQGGAPLPLNYQTASSGVAIASFGPNNSVSSFYVQATGLYRVDYNFTFSYPAQTTLHVQLVKNGAPLSLAVITNLRTPPLATTAQL